MLEFLPEDIRKGLMLAQDRARRRAGRLAVHAGDTVFPVLRLWEGGFVVESARVPRLRGRVDLYDGPRHLSQCLIVAAADEGGTTTYEFKRHTAVQDRPPADYARGDDLPSGYLPGPT